MIATFLIVGLGVANSQTLVDTNAKYDRGLPFGVGKNDCSVRVIATINDLSYMEAHSVLSKLGRNNNKGFDSRVLLQHLKASGKLVSIDNIKDKKLTSRKMIKKDSLDYKYDYIALSRGHIFAIKHSDKNWIVYGNSDDLDNKINYLVKIKRN